MEETEFSPIDIQENQSFFNAKLFKKSQTRYVCYAVGFIILGMIISAFVMSIVSLTRTNKSANSFSFNSMKPKPPTIYSFEIDGKPYNYTATYTEFVGLDGLITMGSSKDYINYDLKVYGTTIKAVHILGPVSFSESNPNSISNAPFYFLICGTNELPCISTNGRIQGSLQDPLPNSAKTVIELCKDITEKQLSYHIAVINADSMNHDSNYIIDSLIMSQC